MGTTVSRELEDGLREARLKAEKSRAERDDPIEVDDILFGDEKVDPSSFADISSYIYSL